jgi:hypothetical protein
LHVFANVITQSGGIILVGVYLQAVSQMNWFGIFFVLVLSLGSGFGFAQQTPGLEGRCQGIEKERTEAFRIGDAQRIYASANDYLKTCRYVRSNPEVSVALWELVVVRRLGGQLSEALGQAQECIKFEYLAVGCHIEKALILDGMGMKSEARQVLKTAADVIGRLESKGRVELASAESPGVRLKPDELAMQIRRGNAHLRLAKQGRESLKAMERMLGVS